MGCDLWRVARSSFSSIGSLPGLVLSGPGLILWTPRSGLFGDAKLLGGGVWELKIDVGPGYRIYYGLDCPRVVVLINAGQKGGQERDIARARAFWENHVRQKGL